MDFVEVKNLSDQELLIMAKRKDDFAIEELLNRFKYIPLSVARSYFLVGGAEEDLVQEGMIGLYRAINTYDDEKGSFKTFVYTCVKNSIISLVKKSKSKKNEPLNEYISLSGDEENDADKKIFFQDAKFSPEQIFINKESEIELQEKIKSAFSKSEFEIFNYYIKGYNYQTISEKVNKPIKSVDNSIQRIKKKIIKILGEKK